MKYSEACIVVFAKEPVAGKVKTRLIPALGAQGALNLHLKLMKQISSVLNNISLCSVQLWVSNNPQHPAFNDFKGEHKLQWGDDLGQKMHNASTDVLEEYESVVIIGSDCPKMDENYLSLALEALANKDVVIGPATDGGYVLIGISEPVAEIFEGVDWGSDQVLAQTRKRLTDNSLSWHELPALSDIDRPEDLDKL